MSLASVRRASTTRRRASYRRNTVEDVHAGCAGFVAEVAAGYQDSRKVPYHNFAHAVDVAFTLHKVFQVCYANLLLMAHERLALMAAALAHDIGHHGMDNAFLISAQTE